ncbi:hypothetical protein [Oceanicoccus sp. KOV_DT_Chl]|uniref:hypothetical protein n=1 Tax=Oceanicoccus sp. KOV_DT_Chl TaxID=1904639 RepID=UPI0011AF63F8|nr:hypothetical protein [Oceanicoccus sp. KOV_DT_Chl]
MNENDSKQNSAHQALNHLVHESYRSKKDAYESVLVFARHFCDGAYEPNFKEYSDDALSLRRVGYLVDFLTRFLDVEKSRKAQLRSELSSVKLLLERRGELSNDGKRSKVSFFKGDKSQALSVDLLAQTWGLEAGLHPSQVPELLDMQRRGVSRP